MATIDRAREAAERMMTNGASASATLHVASSWQRPPRQFVGEAIADLEIAEIAGARVVDEYPETLRRLGE